MLEGVYKTTHILLYKKTDNLILTNTKNLFKTKSLINLLVI